jgi:hypothetical protein
MYKKQMISRDKLLNYNERFKHPNFHSIIDIIYNDYSQYKSIKEIDEYFIKTKQDITMYKDIIRPYIELLFNLNIIDCYLQVYNLECESKRLRDICDLKRGKILAINDIIKGDIPVIGGGINPMGYHNNFNRKENTILVSQSGSNAGYINRYETKTWVSDCFSVEKKNEYIDSINEDYIYYYLKFKQEIIFKLQHGNGQPHVNTNDMESFKIKIPSIEIQNNIISNIENMKEKTKTYLEYSEYLGNQLILFNL